jgi:ribonuclease HI
MENIVIYTDGGCRGNPGVGGWGVWLRYRDHDKKLKGSELNTTNGINCSHKGIGGSESI